MTELDGEDTRTPGEFDPVSVMATAIASTADSISMTIGAARRLRNEMLEAEFPEVAANQVGYQFLQSWFGILFKDMGG